MSKKKQIKVLLAVLAGLLICYLAAGWITDYRTSKSNEESAVTYIDKGDVISVECSSEYGDFAFAKEEGEWTYEGDTDMPVKQNYVKKIVNAAASISSTKKMNKHDDLSYYGLEEPAYTIKLTEEDGVSTTIEYGNSADTSTSYEDEGTYYYVTVNGGKTIFVGDGNVLDRIPTSINDFVKNDSFPNITESNLKSLEVSQDGKQILKVTSGKKDKSLRKKCGNELSTIELTGCVDYKATSKELQKYGLDKESRKTCKATYEKFGNKKNVKFYISEPQESEEESVVYIQMNGSKLVYSVDASDIKTVSSVE